MAFSRERTKGNALRLLEELPGIADVVWTAVLRLSDEGAPASVLFTAPEKRAGTSVLAAATAVGLAEHQRVPVCLVETNVQRPAQAGYFGLETKGLSDVLDGRAELEECVQQAPGCASLLVLPAGTPRAPLFGEFTTERLNSILARLKTRCRYLVLDAAPLLDHVESRVLLRHVDTALLVLRARGTRLDDAGRALDILVKSGIPVLGSIFNADRTEHNARANRLFMKAVRAERPRPGLEPLTLGDETAPVETGVTAAERESLWAANGGGAPVTDAAPLEAPAAADEGTDAAGRRQIDILERRIVKLTQLLEQTEADLRRIAAMKNVDLGIASIYRSVQGLSSEEGALAFKRSIMKKIFQANVELKTAIARHP